MYDNNLFNVDTTNVEKMGGYEVYPPGLYPAVMISAAKKPTAKNDGAFIECVYQFIDGDHAGKKFTSRMNLWNQNTQAVDIAKRELKSLRAATGNSDIESDLAKFVNRPVILNISAKPRKDNGQPENNLVAIEPYGAAAPVAAPAPQYVPQMPVAPPPGAGWAPQTTGAPVHMQPNAGTPVHQLPNAGAPAFQPGTGAAPWLQGAR